MITNNKIGFTFQSAFGIAMAAAAALAIGGTSNPVQASVTGTVNISNLGTSVPTPGASDQYDLTATAATAAVPYGYGTGTNNMNYFTNNAQPPGETFTTGTNAAGYNLNAITVLDLSEYGAFKSGYTVTLDIYSVNATAATSTLLDTFSGAAGSTVNASSNDYIQISLANPLVLTSGTVYGYSISTPVGSSNPNSGLGADTHNNYTGGVLAEFTPGTNQALITNSNWPNAVFDASLTPVTAVPAPATFALVGLGSLALLGLKRRKA